MHLPDSLQEAIEKETEKFPLSEILKAREALTERYQKGQAFMSKDVERCAYIGSRMPATYAAVRRSLQEIGGEKIESLLDLGAGPGTVMWTASEIFQDLKEITLIEKDRDLASLGKRLALSSEYPSVREANWRLEDLGSISSFPEHDLVVFSYSAGELKDLGIIQRAWKSARKFLAVIEPGTPRGFEKIRKIRSDLISLGAHLSAPCPHAEACPMKGGDWCHFSERVARTSLHRKIKGGSLGHEDEKFSYVIVSKMPRVLPYARILRHPLKRPGNITFTLCSQEGLKQEIISKRTPDRYKEARKLEWGSSVGLNVFGDRM